MRRLLIRPGAIGDVILSLPALEFLRADYTEVWAPRPVVPLIRFADRVRAIPDSGLDLLEIPGQAPAALVRALGDFDEIVSWYGAGRENFAAAAGRLPIRLLTAVPPPDSREHAADYFRRQVGAPPANPRIECTSDPGGFAVIHPFSGSPAKNWPLDRYRALAQTIDARMPLCWSAGPEEILDAAQRFDDLYALACWLHSARFYIGNDSGITHLAAAVGTPTLALFGPTDPAVWAPRGPHVRVLSTCAAGEPIDLIAVAEVESALRKLW